MQSMRSCLAVSEVASCCISSPSRRTLQGPTCTGYTVTTGSAVGACVGVAVSVTVAIELGDGECVALCEGD